MNFSEKFSFRAGEIILVFSGFLVLASVIVFFLSDNITVMAASKVVYALGVVLFWLDK